MQVCNIFFKFLAHQELYIHTRDKQEENMSMKRVFHLIQASEGPQAHFSPPSLVVPVSGYISSPFHAPIKDHPYPAVFFHRFCGFLLVGNVSLTLKSIKRYPVKISPLGCTVDILSSHGGHPVHTQVPWWCTMCLRCFRPRPLSLQSVTRCWLMSTRALAIATPGSPKRTENEQINI